MNVLNLGDPQDAGQHHIALQPGTPLQTLDETIRLCRYVPPDGVPSAVSPTPLRNLLCTDNQTEFNIVPFDESREYIAISYSWPSTDSSWARLSISNQESTIIANGSSHLSKHFSRFASQAVYSCADVVDVRSVAVWIDHECINQEDETEQKRQMAVMDSIYIGARFILILLEDIGMSTEEYDFLTRERVKNAADTVKLVALVRRILEARWFSRAWCSQELILSRGAIVVVHCSDKPGEIISFAYGVLTSWVARARIYDKGLNELREPRGLHLDTFARKTVAWAWATVNQMRCGNEYDKIALIHNLIRAKIETRLTSLPVGLVKATPDDILNIYKIINVWAIEQKDFSLLASGHLESNSELQKAQGFSWAALPSVTDPTLESWDPGHYCISHDPHVILTPGGLRMKGIAAKIISRSEWQIWRDDNDKLFVNVDGNIDEVSTDWWQEGELQSNSRLQVLRDVLLAVAHHKEMCIYRALLHPDDDSKLTHPSPRIQDFREDIRFRFRHRSAFRFNIAEDLRMAQSNGKVCLNILKFADDHEMTVYGNAARSAGGNVLFQPHVLRPSDLGDWQYSANAMVLENADIITSGMQRRSVGYLRCFQMLPAEMPGMPEIEIVIS